MNSMNDITRQADMNVPKDDATQCVIGCPFFDGDNNHCMVSSQSTRPDSGCRLHYCRTDDFDNCPLYLCRALRTGTRVDWQRQVSS